MTSKTDDIIGKEDMNEDKLQELVIKNAIKAEPIEEVEKSFRKAWSCCPEEFTEREMMDDPAGMKALEECNEAIIKMIYYQKARAETIKKVEEKLNEAWHKRTFVTGNITSQWEREKAYKDGWEHGFQKARKTIGELK